MMKILHAVPGLGNPCNGIAVAARLVAREQGADLVEARQFARGEGGLDGYDEVWVHSCWLPMTLKSCWRVLRSGKALVVMTHGNLDPVRLKYHGWKKRLVGPIERWCLRRCDRIVATCEAEKDWIEAYLGEGCPEIEVTDVKRFFKLVSGGVESGGAGEFGGGGVAKNSQLITHNSQLHLLYLGRRHPLKGVEYLEEAVRQIQNTSAPLRLCVRMVSSAFGEEFEKVWEWCDVLVLPTLSENFGLVVAEALERGKRVITTDGAPAWGESLELRVGSGGVGENSRVERVDREDGGLWSGYGGRLIYLKRYRDGTKETRVELLKKAIERLGE